MKQQKYDILIVGGGISGAMAGTLRRPGWEPAVSWRRNMDFWAGCLPPAGGSHDDLPFRRCPGGRGVCGELIERMKKKGRLTRPYSGHNRLYLYGDAL